MKDVISVQNFLVPLHLLSCYKKIDRRSAKSRKYAAHVTCYLEVKAKSWEDAGKFPGYEVGQKLLALFRRACGVLDMEDITRITEGEMGLTWSFLKAGEFYHNNVVFNFEVHADRPSKILSQEEILGRLNSALFQFVTLDEEPYEETEYPHIRQAILDCIREGLTEKTESEKAVQRAELANRILNHMARVLTDKAKENCRYNQRLTALNAELEAEKDVLAAASVDEMMREGIQFSDGEAVDNRVVTAVMKALPEYIKQHKTNPLFGSNYPDEGPVTPDNVH